jgi:hypothetical protein
MKIALFYPPTAWSLAQGVREGLTRLGHAVSDGSDGHFIHMAGQDLIFVSGPEYLWKQLRVNYPKWDLFTAKKVGWLHETVEREDYETNPIAVHGNLPLDELKRFTPYLFTPAIQDRKYDLHFMPFGVDTKFFVPTPKIVAQSPIYTGSVYGKRRAFLDRYPTIRKGAQHPTYQTSIEYARGIAEAPVIIGLPSLSMLTVTSVFEALASKTPLITPALSYPDGLFEHGKHLLYYDTDPCALLKDIDPDMARRGYDEILAYHTIEHRLSAILNIVFPQDERTPSGATKNLRRPIR